MKVRQPFDGVSQCGFVDFLLKRYDSLANRFVGRDRMRDVIHEEWLPRALKVSLSV